jgi:hypothetical protein
MRFGKISVLVVALAALTSTPILSQASVENVERSDAQLNSESNLGSGVGLIALLSALGALVALFATSGGNNAPTSP